MTIMDINDRFIRDCRREQSFAVLNAKYCRYICNIFELGKINKRGICPFFAAPS